MEQHPSFLEEHSMKPNRRFRRWLIILFLVLVSVVTVSVLLLSRPKPARFEFLVGKKLIWDYESIMVVSRGGPILVGETAYRVAKSKDWKKAIEDEIKRKGLALIGTGEKQWAYADGKGELFVGVFDKGDHIRVSVSETSTATGFDKARVWIKEGLPFLQRKPILDPRSEDD